MMDYDAILSRRERQIASLVASGASNKEIARELNLCHQTVRNRLTQVFAKTKTRSRTELAVRLLSVELEGSPGAISGLRPPVQRCDPAV